MITDAVFVKKLQELRPGQIATAMVEPLDLDTLYRMTRAALDNDCYTVFQQPYIHMKKLPPVDDTGYPGMAFAIPTRVDDKTFYETAAISPTIKDPRNELFTMCEQPSPRNVLDFAVQNTKHEFVVFTHHDVYLPKNWGPRFWRAITEAERRFGPIGVAGVFGVSGDRRKQRTEAGAVIDQNGTRA